MKVLLKLLCQTRKKKIKLATCNKNGTVQIYKLLGAVGKNTNVPSIAQSLSNDLLEKRIICKQLLCEGHAPRVGCNK